MSRLPALQVRVRIDFTSGPSLGPGKIALLERIAAVGSLSQAARDLGLSYRRAWVLLDDINRAFGEPAAVTATGGARGGGATLTPLGAELVARYRAVEKAADRAASRAFLRLAAAVGGAGAGSGAARTPRGAPGSLRRPLSRKPAAR